MSDLEQGHGDSWDTIYEDMDTLISFIPTAISQATEVAGYAKVLYQVRRQAVRDNGVHAVFRKVVVFENILQTLSQA